MQSIRSVLRRPPFQAILFSLIVFLIYLQLIRPQEIARDVEIDGSLAYLALGHGGIKIVDIANQNAPREVGSYNTQGSANGIHLYEHYLLVADGKEGLLILDRSDPAELHAVSFFDTPGTAEDVTVAGRFAYIADGRAGLQVIDLDEPENPVFPNNYTPYKPRAALMQVAVEGRRVYLADSRRRLWIADIETRRSPTQIGVYDARDRIQDVFLRDQIAYLAVDKRGLVIVDLTSPGEPNEIDSFDTPGIAHGVAIAGAYAYIADGRSGLRIIDTSNPSDLADVGGYKGEIYDATDLVVRDHTVFLADRFDGLRIVEATVEVEPELVSPEVQPSNAEDVAAQAGFAYLASESRGVRVIDVSQPASPVEVGLYDTPGQANGIAVAGDYVYVADGDQGLQILSIANRDAQNFILEPAARQESPGQVQDVALDSKYVYLAAGEGGLRIISIEDPASPELAGVEESIKNAWGVAVLGNYAYIADGPDGLRVVDVTDRTKPAVVGTADTDGEARAVAVQRVERDGGRIYAYVADGEGGLAVIEVTDPRAPRPVGFNHEPEYAYDVTIKDHYVFLAGRRDGVWVIDIADPSKPLEVGFYDTPGEAHGLAIEENFVYISAYERGLRVLDASTPASLREVGFFDVPRQVADVAVSDFAYLIDEGRGIRVVRIDDPQTLQEIGFYDTPGRAEGIAIQDGFAYVGVDNSLRIIDISDPANLHEVGHVDVPGRVTGVSVEGNYAFTSIEHGHLQVVDVSDPEAPVRAGAHDTPGPSLAIDVQGNYVFIAEGLSGLQIINVLDRNAPVRSSVIRGCTDARGVLAAGDYAYVASGEHGLCVVNVAKPPTPEIVATLPLEGTVLDVDFSQPYLFLAGDQGVRIVNVFNPARPVLVGSVDTRASYSAVDVIEQPANDGRPQSFLIYAAGETLGLQVLRAEKSLAPVERGLYETPGIFPLRRLLNEFLHMAFSVVSGEPLILQAKTWWTVLVMTFDLTLFIAAALIWIALVAQYILPVERANERLLAIRRLLAYLLGLIGPGIYVKEGSPYLGPVPYQSMDREVSGPGPSVVMVDASSAAILIQRRVRYPLLVTLVLEWISGFLRRWALRPGSEKKAPPKERIIGPGLTFTIYRPFPGYPGFAEQLRSVADLRPQIRLRPEVQAYTKDGIEVKTIVFNIFTLGQPPEKLLVAYQGEERPQNLRVVQVEEKISSEAAGEWRKKKVIRDLSDELDPEDQEEIHRFVRQYRQRGETEEGIELERDGKRNGPYLFDPERIHAAVYTQAQDVQEDANMPWTDLPVHAAAQVFRDILAEKTYDELYIPPDPIDYPLARLKKKFALQVRNLGVLAHQFVERRDGRQLETGQDWDEEALALYPVQELHNPKVLRSHGIKVILAGFSELKPQDEVRERLLDSWGARWDQEAEIVLAELEKRAIGVRRMAREEAEQELAETIARILATSDYPEEALAVHVFKTLEEAVADPVTRKLLPADTLGMLHYIRLALMPGDVGPSSSPSGGTPPPPPGGSGPPPPPGGPTPPPGSPPVFPEDSHPEPPSGDAPPDS